MNWRLLASNGIIARIIGQLYENLKTIIANAKKYEADGMPATAETEIKLNKLLLEIELDKKNNQEITLQERIKKLKI